MPRHLIGDAHEWINEIPTVPTHSLAKLQPSQQSWEYLCVLVSHGFLKQIYISIISSLQCVLFVCCFVFLFNTITTEHTHIHTHTILNIERDHIDIYFVFNLCCATAGQEDPFELDSNLLLSSGRHGEDCKRQYFCTIMKHRDLT